MNTCGSVSEVFGSNVFSDAVMRERLPRDVYRAFKKVVQGHQPLDLSIANVIANAMKDWAIEKGATHFCHWFQPMTGLTAEKHDAFINPTPEGRVIMEFSGKELIQGEPDASSFPSGGLRATFEARGYTAWDITSPAFIKADGSNISLFIPSAFCSYTGQALDKKTPLLRSGEALSRQAIRVLRALGNTTSSRVTATAGPEQEYFIIDERFYLRRLDLVLTGRTLFGAPSPRGQELEDQYLGSLHERIGSFMNEVNTTLWKLGISAKTQHNEVAPSQHEIAPVYTTVNVATDHNQLTMETLVKVARRHGLVCLLNEKPFAGVNGSGKHNNWSMATDDGINLLDPGSTPHENMQFLVVLCAVIRAVDRYANLLRSSVAVPGNDHRLGANEAPPAIVSIFLGEQLTDIFEQLAEGKARSSKKGGLLQLGISTLPSLPKDSTDRNRTSPFAFTGNKFEFRMVGSSQSIAGPNFVLNTIVAESFREIADELEKASDIEAAAQKICSRIAREHGRIVYNGDNYSQEWVKEASRRGLPNIRSTVESLKRILDEENVEVLERHGVLARHELEPRVDVLYEIYSKTITIEARTMVSIARRQITPAVSAFAGRLADTLNAVGQAGASTKCHKGLLERVCGLFDTLQGDIDRLEKALVKSRSAEGAEGKAEACFREVVPMMAKLRSTADELEQIVDADLWPLPSYAEMLFIK
jgi:glutamine synthetase